MSKVSNYNDTIMYIMTHNVHYSLHLYKIPLAELLSASFDPQK